MLRSLVICGVISLGFNACKTANESSLQSLGALAGDKSANTCSANGDSSFAERYDTFWSGGGVVAGSGYKDLLKGVFASVPTPLQSWYFLKGGKVQLIGNPKQYCTQFEATPLFYSSSEQGGCVVFPKENDLAGMPTIYVGVTGKTKTEQLEQASLIVAGFSTVLSSFLTEIATADNLSASNELLYEFGAYDVEMRNLKASLAFMVIEDLIKNKNAEGKTYAEAMPENYKAMIASSKVLDTSMSRDDRWKAFWGAYNDAGHREMTNFLVAQVFETAWCSDTTRTVLFSESAPFNETGRYFKNEVEQVFADAYAGKAQASSMGLTDVTSSSSDEAALEAMSAAPTSRSSLELGGRVFPVLGAVLSAPFAVGQYFVDRRPARSWFGEYRPVRRVMFGTVRAVGSVARGAVVFTGRVAGGVGRVAGNGLDRVGYRIQNGCLIRRWRC
jgi:hypothetical protein